MTNPYEKWDFIDSSESIQHLSTPQGGRYHLYCCSFHFSNSYSTMLSKCLLSWVCPKPHMIKKISNRIWCHFSSWTRMVHEIPDAQRALIHVPHLLLVSFIYDPKHWWFSFRNLFLSEFSLLYDCHTHFGCNIRKGHFISFNAVSFSNMDMMFGEFPPICTITPYSVGFSPVLKTSSSWVVLSPSQFCTW